MRKFGALIVVLGALALPAAGIGRSAASRHSGGTSAKARKVLKAGTFGVLVTSTGSEVIDHWVTVTEQALKAAGQKYVAGLGQGLPTTQSQVIQSFVREHVQGIITVGGWDPGSTTQALQEAKAAGIPVIATGITVQNTPTHLLAANYAPSDYQFGRVLARYLARKLPAGTQYVDITISSIPGVEDMILGANPILKHAGFVNVGEHDLTTTNYATETSSAAVSLLQANPKAKLLISCCDFTPALTVPALKQAGFGNVLQTGRYDNLSTLKLIREGAPVVVSAGNAILGPVTSVDQMLAFMAGRKINPNADNGKWTYSVITKSNLPKPGAFSYPAGPLIAQYLATWRAEYVLPKRK